MNEGLKKMLNFQSCIASIAFFRGEGGGPADLNGIKMQIYWNLSARRLLLLLFYLDFERNFIIKIYYA